MLGQCQHVNNDVLPTTPTQRYPTLAQRLLAIWDNANVGHRMIAIWEILVGLVFIYPRGAGIWLGFSIGPTPANTPARTLYCRPQRPCKILAVPPPCYHSTLSVMMEYMTHLCDSLHMYTANNTQTYSLTYLRI